MGPFLVGSTADIGVSLRICRLAIGRVGSSSWRVAFTVTPFCAVAASSPSASTRTCWSPGRDEQRGSIKSSTVHCLGLALGGRPAASFSRRLMLPVSNDTLLRVVRRRGSPRFVAPTVVGIDDWAWRRNQRYGTIICDLERRKTIALLPDREPTTAQEWLAKQPQISIVPAIASAVTRWRGQGSAAGRPGRRRI